MASRSCSRGGRPASGRKASVNGGARNRKPRWYSADSQTVAVVGRAAADYELPLPKTETKITRKTTRVRIVRVSESR